MDLFGIDLADLDATMAVRGLDDSDDAVLAGLASDVLSRPRTADTSFTLHAPLELVARVRLLGRVSPAARSQARRRLVALAAGYDQAGDPVDEPARPVPRSAEEAVALLRTALTHGDLDLADSAAVGLGRHCTPATLRDLLATDLVAPLGAAGHAPILLASWPQVPVSSPLNGSMTRHLFRNLAGEAPLRFRFERPNAARPPASLAHLDAALAEVEPVGDPGFGIFELMEQAERHDALAAIPGVDLEDVPDAFKLVLRRAATAMLTDDPGSAPYGWSHALTMPLALAQIATHTVDPTVALDAAITEWCGFRMGHGRDPVSPFEPVSTGKPPADMLDSDSHRAAAIAWHHPDREAIIGALVDNAATNHDAHLVKYTVASLDTAALDPDHERLYLAGAAYLAAWWVAAGPGADPLVGVTS